MILRLFLDETRFLVVMRTKGKYVIAQTDGDLKGFVLESNSTVVKHDYFNMKVYKSLDIVFSVNKTYSLELAPRVMTSPFLNS